MQDGDEEIKQQAERVAQLDLVSDSQTLAQAIFTTVYMGTVNSSDKTRSRAQTLADEIGADHLDVKVDRAVDAMAQLFAFITGKTPKFKVTCSASSLMSVECCKQLLNLGKVWLQLSHCKYHCHATYI